MSDQNRDYAIRGIMILLFLAGLAYVVRLAFGYNSLPIELQNQMINFFSSILSSALVYLMLKRDLRNGTGKLIGKQAADEVRESLLSVPNGERAYDPHVQGEPSPVAELRRDTTNDQHTDNPAIVIATRNDKTGEHATIVQPLASTLSTPTTAPDHAVHADQPPSADHGEPPTTS